ncbi:hypothetical protein, partial [Nostoc sp. CCY 9925]|uniref:hypothetical protein n=1 Tax=Nostoc sp. CCY 9925 TaxID=3103865 RepID=UPI0039C5AC41
LMDAEIEGPPTDQVWVNFGVGRAFICLPYAGKTVRLFTYGQPLIDSIPRDWRLGEIRWRSDFTVSHRIADRLSVGRIAL